MRSEKSIFRSRMRWSLFSENSALFVYNQQNGGAKATGRGRDQSSWEARRFLAGTDHEGTQSELPFLFSSSIAIWWLIEDGGNRPAVLPLSSPILLPYRAFFIPLSSETYFSSKFTRLIPIRRVHRTQTLRSCFNYITKWETEGELRYVCLEARLFRKFVRMKSR